MGTNSRTSAGASTGRAVRARVRKRVVVALLAAVAVVSTGSDASAGDAPGNPPTVTPNPVAAKGSITVTPHPACSAAMANVPRDRRILWEMFDSTNNVQARIAFSATALTFEVPAAPGVYLLLGVERGDELRVVPECGSTFVMVSGTAVSSNGLVVSRGAISLNAGETASVARLFVSGPRIPTGVTVQRVVVTLTSGLTFANGASVFGADGPSALNAALAQVITAKTFGVVRIRIDALGPGGTSAITDQTEAGLWVSAAAAPSNPAPVTPPANPAPANPAPANPAPAIPAPANPAPANPAPANPAPVTPPAPTNPASPPTTAAATGGNRPPTAVGKSVVVKKNTATAIVLKGTDPEGARLVYSVLDFPENGRLTGRAPNLTYKPESGFVGTDAFTFTVSDGVSTSEESVVTLTVISTKAAPKVTTKKTTKKATTKKTTKKK